jgi:hypothetical protein
MLRILLVTLAVCGGRECLEASQLLAGEPFHAIVRVNVSVALVLSGEALLAYEAFELLNVLALVLAGLARLGRRYDRLAKGDGTLGRARFEERGGRSEGGGVW